MCRFLDMMKSGRFALVMSLPSNDPLLARAAWENGADVVKVHVNLLHHASGVNFGSFSECGEVFRGMLGEARGPMGIVLGTDCSVAEAELPKAAAAGFDFVSLYGQHAPVSLLRRTDVGKMIAPDFSWSDEETAFLEKAGADILEASVVPQQYYGSPFSVRDLAAYCRICSLTKLPVVVPTQKTIAPEDVGQLRDAGVSALMIGAIVTGNGADGIARTVAAFRKAIDRLG